MEITANPNDDRNAPTRFATFLRSAPFTMAQLSRTANVNSDHLRDLKRGKAQPRLDMIKRLRKAASELAGRDVAAAEMFDIEG